MSSRMQRISKFLAALKILRAQLPNPPLSNSDNLVGGVDVLPAGNLSVFLESENGVDCPVKEPEISSGSLHAVVAVSDLLEASNASSLQPEPAFRDCPPVDVVIDVDSAGGEMVADGGEVICPSESSTSADDGDEDDELSKYGDSSCPSEEPFYFAMAPSKSFSKKYAVEVSRHDIAFVHGAPRFMCLWEGESHLVFGIGGHMRTVVDWHLVPNRNETAVSGWLQVSDPARPDVPLWIEFAAVYGKEEVEAGTALQRPNESLVPWIFMMDSTSANCSSISLFRFTKLARTCYMVPSRVFAMALRFLASLSSCVDDDDSTICLFDLNGSALLISFIIILTIKNRIDSFVEPILEICAIFFYFVL